MKRYSICLLFWTLLIALSYGGGYLCFAWPLSHLEDDISGAVITTNTNKKDFIVPSTRLIMETVDLRTGERSEEHKAMPAVYLGLDRLELLEYLSMYMKELSIDEREKGLVSFELENYSMDEVHLKKLYYEDENYKRFYMVYKNGRMVVYHSDKKTVYDYPDVKLHELPLDLQCQMITGMEIKDEVELYNFLQNYSS